jgi:hypothetical protein
MLLLIVVVFDNVDVDVPTSMSSVVVDAATGHDDFVTKEGDGGNPDDDVVVVVLEASADTK